MLVSKLPHIIESIIIEYEQFCHLDLIWGKYAKQYVFEPLIESLEKFINKTNIKSSTKSPMSLLNSTH